MNDKPKGLLWTLGEIERKQAVDSLNRSFEKITTELDDLLENVYTLEEYLDALLTGAYTSKTSEGPYNLPF